MTDDEPPRWRPPQEMGTPGRDGAAAILSAVAVVSLGLMLTTWAEDKDRQTPTALEADVPVAQIPMRDSPVDDSAVVTAARHELDGNCLEGQHHRHDCPAWYDRVILDSLRVNYQGLRYHADVGTTIPLRDAIGLALGLEICTGLWRAVRNQTHDDSPRVIVYASDRSTIVASNPVGHACEN